MAAGPLDKKNNALPMWGNEKTMNLNNMILTNILSSHYFKVNLYQLKTFHEVVDEIYYNVSHLEPWEKGSRKTSGQTGMCGGVRGVGAGGIVSTAFCILYKLFTLKLTRKQVIGLITHCDSPYIRGLGFMYIRYTQPPADLWDWYETYLNDEEEIDVKAGGGQIMTIGEMLRHFLCKLEWHSTLFPRTPVPIQKDIERRLSAFIPKVKVAVDPVAEGNEEPQEEGEETKEGEGWTQEEDEAARSSRKETTSSNSRNGGWSGRERPEEGKERHRNPSPQRSRHKDASKDRVRERTDRDKDRTRHRERSSSRERHRRNVESRHHDRHHRSRSTDARHRPSSRTKHRSRSRDRGNTRRR